MAFRFFRRMKLAPGVSLNLSKSGASLSFGPRGAKVTVGPRGVRKTIGIPGTGMYWTERSGYGGRRRKSGKKAAPPVNAVRPEDQLSLGFFQRLITPQNEEDFVDGMKQFVLGRDDAALGYLRKATDLGDAAFMAGVLSLKQQRFADAERFLQAALRRRGLGRYFQKYGIQAAAALAITEEVAAFIGPDRRGLLLALAEVHQHLGRPQQSIDDLKQLYRRQPEDVVVRLSLAELLVEESPHKRSWQAVVRLAEGIENESEIHAGLLLYKAKALRKLNLLTAARDTLTSTMRRKKDRTDELLRALRYERALVYEELGHSKRAKSDLEKLYAEAPDYEDVAQRLGLWNGA
jgi:tetratricopeptide (TPR) repeat protein